MGVDDMIDASEQKIDELLSLMRSAVPDPEGMNDAGRIGFVYRYDYDPAETYEKLDVVLYGPSLWTPKQNTTGNAPPDQSQPGQEIVRENEFWQIYLPGALGTDYVKKTDIAVAPTETEPGKPGISMPDGKTITIDKVTGMLKGAPSGKTLTQKEMNEQLSKGELVNGDVVYLTGPASGENGLLVKVDKELNTDSVNPVQNKVIAVSIKNISDESKIRSQILNGIYKGRNLADVFDSEISRYSNEWEWMKDRISTGFFEGLFVADFIPLTLTDGEYMEQQIAAIVCSDSGQSQGRGNYIDFISRDCYSERVKWSLSNNNGNSETPYPYMASNIKKWLNETLFQKIPDNLKSMISAKTTRLEQRYSDSGLLSESTSWGNQEIGKLWIPHEFEVFGCTVFGTPGWSQGNGFQYPVFVADSMSVFKKERSGGEFNSWHLCSVRKGSSTHACGVGNDGICGPYTVSAQNTRSPVCFRIS